MTPPACYWVRSVLSAYLAGELMPSTATAVRRHLERCASCRTEAELLDEGWHLLDAVRPPPVRPGFTARMMARIVDEKELHALESSLRTHDRWRQVLASAAGMAAGLLLGFALYGWTGLMQEPNSPVEREVSRNVAFLEDADLLDDIGTIEAMDRLTHGEDVSEEGV